MPGLLDPPFPEGLKTHPLLVIDFELIKAGNAQEAEKLWEAATSLGFWYLKNHGADNDVDTMFKMGEEVMDLSFEEKMKSRDTLLGDSYIGSFGYKAKGEYVVDKDGTPDVIEFISIAKDDILAFPEIVHLKYPAPVENHMASTLKPFLRKALDVNNTILSVFEKKLGLPGGSLLKLHTLEDQSGSEARVLKTPAKLTSSDADSPRIALIAHTDVGSLSFLHNRLGGLQVLPPGSDDWQYVRPLPGHAICNIGDALALLSGGILHSSMHRVVLPPGAQGGLPRWSMVFQQRPGQDIPLRALAEESPLIRDALESVPVDQRAKYTPNETAGEWFSRRVKYLRKSNHTGTESWQAKWGMEHRPDAI